MLQARFENGTQGAEVKSSDPGGPDAFDVTVMSATTLVYDNTHARDTLAAKFLTGATGDTTCVCRWTTSYGTQTDVYQRAYVWLSDNPINGAVIMAVDVAGAMGPRVRIHADRLLRLVDNAGVIQATAGTALPIGQWVRLEWHIVHDVTAGSMELRVYTVDPEVAVENYDYSVQANAINTGASSNGFRFGWALGFANQPAMWIDDVAAAASTWIGPTTEPAIRDVISFSAFPAATLGTATLTTLSNYTSKQTEADDRLQFVTDQNCPWSPIVLRVELRQDDFEHNGHSERTEFSANGYTYAPGQEFWLAMGPKLDATFPSLVGTGLWQLVHQMFGETGGESTGSPPFGVEIDTSDRWSMTVRGGTKATAANTAPRESFLPLVPATKNVWWKMLFHFVLAKDATGLNEAYICQAGQALPGSPTASVTGNNVLTVNGIDQLIYPETGQYRATRSAVGVLYHSGMKIAATRAEAEAFFDAADSGDGTQRTISRLQMIHGTPILLPS